VTRPFPPSKAWRIAFTDHTRSSFVQCRSKPTRHRSHERPDSLVNTLVGRGRDKGVEKLSSLEELDCSGSGLKTLPDLSHLPHLRHVELRSCPVVKDPSSPYYERDDVQFDRENKHVDVSDTSDSE
jgi:Leucine-rich repeat (LRR) protein